MVLLATGLVVATGVLVLRAQAPAASKSTDKQANKLKYNDGTAECKKSLGGSGEMIAFALPDADQDLSDTVATKTSPYSRFERGPEGWVEIKFSKPLEVP